RGDEEERRLAYVAITRAKDELYISHAKSRMLYGRTGANPASRFLGEIPESLLDKPKVQQTAQGGFGYGGNAAYRRPESARQIAATDRITVGRAAAPRPAIERFAAGDRVRHMAFGEGTILTVTKIAADTLYEIAFDTKGTKKLMATYAKLKKI
ncbi:MAG: ATP-dependent DNA helicase PcrA, partial [Ruminococcaceae bacterium]|nr:ATP-dependent DNA helicase PcrA [Oscillospiraceae bacterium]